MVHWTLLMYLVFPQPSKLNWHLFRVHSSRPSEILPTILKKKKSFLIHCQTFWKSIKKYSNIRLRFSTKHHVQMKRATPIKHKSAEGIIPVPRMSYFMSCWPVNHLNPHKPLRSMAGGCVPKLDNFLLLKTTHALTAEHGEIRLQWSWDTFSQCLAFIVSAIGQAAGELSQQSYLYEL